MAITRKDFVGDGSTTVYNVDFDLGYLRKEFVYVYQGNDYTTQLGYSWIGSDRIELDSPVNAGESFSIRRVIPRDEPINDYEDGAILREKNLDDSFLQLLMILEEIEDGYITTDGDFDLNGDIDMNGYRITELGEPQANDDAARIQDIINIAEKAKGANFVQEEIPIAGLAQGIRWYKPSVPAIYTYYIDEDGLGQWVQEPTEHDPSLIESTRVVESIAELRSVGAHPIGAVYVKGYTTPNDGGSGMFIMDNTFPYDEDGGFVVIDVNGYKWVRDSIYVTPEFYGAATADDATEAHQAALDAMLKYRLPLHLVRSYSGLSDLYARPAPTPDEDYCKINGGQVVLTFDTGGLWIQASSAENRDFRCTTNDATSNGAILIQPFVRPVTGDTGFPVRGTFNSVRADDSETNGWYIASTWILQFTECYARYNKKWGVMLDHTYSGIGSFGISCNNLLWSGGEIQGNGNVTTGEYGGVFHGRLIGGRWDSCAIEGNYGNGVNMVGANNNIEFDTCYIEKNGRNVNNLDFYTPQVASPADRPVNIKMKNCNHTAITGGQLRCIDINDADVIIEDPVFFGSASSSYTEEPIRVRESVGGYSKGHVKRPKLLWSGYTKGALLNETTSFGQPEEFNVLGFQEMPTGVDTSFNAVIPVNQKEVGRRVEIVTDFRCLTSSGDVKTRVGVTDYPTPTLFGLVSDTDNITSSTFLRKEYISTSASLSRFAGGVGVNIGRIGTDVSDTLSSSLYLAGATVKVFKGVVE